MGMITPDRDIVITGLVCIAGYNHLQSNPCTVCDYQNCETYAGCIHQIAVDALELLQVAVRPIKFKKELDFHSDIVDAYRCGNCQHELDDVEKWRYCPKCGLEVKWDDD